jgi:hypothetical protein
MSYRNRKFAFALSLLLILSQWLSLAHATEHMVDSGDAYCQVCTLQHQFQATTVDSFACPVVVTEKSYSRIFDTYLLTTTPDSARSIRAPPL